MYAGHSSWNGTSGLDWIDPHWHQMYWYWLAGYSLYGHRVQDDQSPSANVPWSHWSSTIHPALICIHGHCCLGNQLIVSVCLWSLIPQTTVPLTLVLGSDPLGLVVSPLCVTCVSLAGAPVPRPMSALIYCSGLCIYPPVITPRIFNLSLFPKGIPPPAVRLGKILCDKIPGVINLVPRLTVVTMVTGADTPWSWHCRGMRGISRKRHPSLTGIRVGSCRVHCWRCGVRRPHFEVPPNDLHHERCCQDQPHTHHTHTYTPISSRT